ncbi:unnamed protein product [Rhodiola kirilowii]
MMNLFNMANERIELCLLVRRGARASAKFKLSIGKFNKQINATLLPLPTFVGLSTVAGGANLPPMRTRNQSNRQSNRSSGEGERTNEAPVTPRTLESHCNADCGTLSSISKLGVDKLLKRVKSRGARAKNEKVAWPDGEDGKGSTSDSMDVKCVAKSSIEAIDSEVKDPQGVNFDRINDETDDSIWEDGSVPDAGFNSNNDNYNLDDASTGVELNISWPDEYCKKKTTRRVSVEEKEIAENVHKVNLLCLLARGRLVDKACDDSLTQAALLSLLPKTLHDISELSRVTKNCLAPIVAWFQKHFRIRPSKQEERSFPASLTSALEAGEGTPEEVSAQIAALSVALFRALNLPTRFVCVLDVPPLKPQAEKPESQSQNDNVVFKSSTLMVDRLTDILNPPAKSFSHHDDKQACETSLNRSKPSEISSTVADSHLSKECPQTDTSGSSNMGVGSKRKGDLEFQMQLQMALSATAATPPKNGSQVSTLETSPSVRKLRKVGIEESVLSTHGVSTAFGSRKIGPPLYWAEVYCTGESSTGRWVHVDAVNNIIDGELKVEAISAACKLSLRYVVAFAGFGAKDVTRRYCQMWYTIASKRTEPIWWDKVLAPLKELELRATGAIVDMNLHTNDRNMVEDVKVYTSQPKNDVVSHGDTSVESCLVKCSDHGNLDLKSTATRNSLEDVELITKALTEPLPTNQQAYKNHPLYAIERWLSKFQILHPKGPVLGFVSGHPVYPRSCVQTLRTKEKWIREGLQLKPDQLPAKVLKRSKSTHSRTSEDDISDSSDVNGSIQLYGVWQTEPLCLPPAVNGIVPKNERGQVDVWAEKCLPPGTVHLKFPRIYPVVKRLGIDSAPAMVGFEFKNGKSFPVFNGIVVCSEFKNTIMEAYREVEERREAEERKRNEAQAIAQWYQLLSSILTRQRLDNCYANDDDSSQTFNHVPKRNNISNLHHSVEMGTDSNKDPKSKRSKRSKVEITSSMLENDHQHVFLRENEVFNEESSVRTKWCTCGFSIQVEEI